MRRRRIRARQLAKPLVADLSWDINIEPAMSGGRVAGNYKAIHRNDNGDLLNIVKKSYHPASNEKLMDTVNRISELTGFSIHGYASRI